MDIRGIIDRIRGVAKEIQEGDVVPFEKFHKKRMEKMGAVTVGPIRVSTKDAIKIGKSKPRQVLDIHRGMIHLGPIKKATRSQPLEGHRYLFWDSGAGLFYSRPAFGMGKDTMHRPEDIHVVKG